MKPDTHHKGDGHPWFTIGDAPGYRTLEQQMTGLEQVLAEAIGKTVLDLGCAEGMIAREFVAAGATVHGITWIEREVETARAVCPGATFECRDLRGANWGPLLPKYDIVLALSIIHKMTDPNAFLARIADLGDRIVVRLPAKVHSDWRTKREITIDPVRSLWDFRLIAEPKTCLQEWLGIFDRC